MREVEPLLEVAERAALRPFRSRGRRSRGDGAQRPGERVAGEEHLAEDRLDQRRRARRGRGIDEDAGGGQDRPARVAAQVVPEEGRHLLQGDASASISATSPAARPLAPPAPRRPRTSASAVRIVLRAAASVEQAGRLGGDPLGVGLALDQLGHHPPAQHQVDQGDVRQPHQQAGEEIGPARQPVDHDHRSAQQAHLQGRRARGTERQVRVGDGGEAVALDDRHRQARELHGLVQQLAGHRGRADDPRFDGQPAGQPPHRRQQRRQQRLDLAQPRAGQEGDAERAVRLLLAAVPGLGEDRHLVHQGMADVDHVHAVAAVEVHLEGEEHQHAVHQAGDGLHPALAPGPHLRADVVDDLQAPLLELAGEAEVEVGKIDQHGERPDGGGPPREGARRRPRGCAAAP